MILWNLKIFGKFRSIVEERLHPLELSDSVKKKLRNEEEIIEDLDQKSHPYKVLDFSDDTLAECYRLGLLLLGDKKYEEALDVFLFLVLLDHTKYDFWVGLGMMQQLCHRYEMAIDAYEVAAICDLLSPIPYFYLAKCLFAIHDRESSLEALNLAIETAGDQEEYYELKLQAQAAKKTLEMMN